MGQTEKKKLIVKFPFTWALGRFRTGKMINHYYRRSSGFSVYSFYLLLAGVVGTSVNTINLASDRPLWYSLVKHRCGLNGSKNEP